MIGKPVAACATGPHPPGAAATPGDWKQGDLSRAVAALETAARLRPDEPRILGDLTSALEAQGRMGEAVAVLHRLEAVRPASAEVARRLAEAYATLGDRSGATRYAARAERLAPQAAWGRGAAR